jgi:hypothetical protein
MSLLQRGLAWLIGLLFSFSSYAIYENTLDGSPVRCQVDDLTLRVITCSEEIDHLSGEGFDVAGLSGYKGAVNKGLILFCAFVGEELVYASQVFMGRDLCCRLPYAINYASTAWVTGDFTAPKHRRKGIHLYVQSKIFQYLRERGLRSAWSNQSKDNIAARNSAIKLGSHLYGEGYQLRLLFFLNFGWIKRNPQVVAHHGSRWGHARFWISKRL